MSAGPLAGRRLYFVGIAGSGMSAYANVARALGAEVRGWDAQTVTNRLEAAVGRDLQYIRINGTLVGGLVGVVLHLVDSL